MDYYSLAIAKGDVPNRSRVHKFGYNVAVGATKATIWAQGGAINWPAAASVMKVSSSAAADDGASTGARTMTIQGLDSDWALAEETVTLDGLTQVTTTTSFVRVFRLVVDTAGSGATNAGVIYVYTGAATDGVPDTATLIYAAIAIAAGQTLQAAYTVPAGHTAYMTDILIASTGNTSVKMTMCLEARKDADVAGSLFVTKERYVLTNAILADDMTSVLPSYTEKTDVMITGSASSSTGEVSANFNLILVKA